MADITMCTNKDCPISNYCYRKTAQASERQSYSMFEFKISIFGNMVETTCAHYYHNGMRNN